MRLKKLVLCVCLSVVATGCDRDNLDYAVGTIERDRIEIVADSNEPIRAVLVTEGDLVEAGGELVRQDERKLLVALERARAERDVTLARLSEAEQGPRAQEIDRSRARLAAAQSAVVTAKLELDRQKSLVARRYSTDNEVDILQGRYDGTIARHDEVEAELAQLLEGTRSEAIDRVRAELAAKNAAVADLQITVDRATLRAPVAGRVESLPFEIGERPRAGQTVVVMLARGRTYARVHVPEPLRTRLRSGSRALVRVDGYPGEFAAQVRWISAEAAFTPYFALTQHDRSRLSYLAEIDLVEGSHLPAGIPVEVTFPDLAEVD